GAGRQPLAESAIPILVPCQEQQTGLLEGIVVNGPGRAGPGVVPGSLIPLTQLGMAAADGDAQLRVAGPQFHRPGPGPVPAYQLLANLVALAELVGVLGYECQGSCEVGRHPVPLFQPGVQAPPGQPERGVTGFHL